MKKLFLLSFTIIAFLCSGQKNDVTVYLNNGTVKSGKGDFVVNDESKMKFIENSQTNTERIKYDDIAKVEYFDTKTKEPFVLERKKISHKRNGGKPTIETIWLNKVKTENDITVYISRTDSDGYTNMSTGNTMTSGTFIGYYFQYKQNMPELIYFNSTDNFLTKKKWVGNFIETFFKDLCPKMADLYRNGKIKLNKDPYPLLNYYNKECSK